MMKERHRWNINEYRSSIFTKVKSTLSYVYELIIFIFLFVDWTSDTFQHGYAFRITEKMYYKLSIWQCQMSHWFMTVWSCGNKGSYIHVNQNTENYDVYASCGIPMFAHFMRTILKPLCMLIRFAMIIYTACQWYYSKIKNANTFFNW